MILPNFMDGTSVLNFPSMILPDFMDGTSVFGLPSMKGAVFVDGRMVFRAAGTKSADLEQKGSANVCSHGAGVSGISCQASTRHNQLAQTRGKNHQTPISRQ